MSKFILRRVFEMIPLLFLLSILVFALFSLVPGDYLTEMESNPSVRRETVQQLREDYGLTRPFYVQYFLWLGQVAQGNLGYSFAQQRPASRLIFERLGNTILLAGVTMILSVFLAFPVAVFAAVNHGRWFDWLVLSLSLAGLSIPTVLAGVFLLFFAFHSGWLPLGGSGGLSYLLPPALTLSLPITAFLVRSLRLEMIEALDAPYVLAAAARGLSPLRVVLHGLRNAINPIISLGGVIFGGLLSGTVVVEKIFDWPGLGALVVDSILSRDLFVVLNCLLISAILIAAANVTADLLLGWNDPRIRYR